MRSLDLDRLRSEKALSLGTFLTSYNEDLPADFPQASRALLREFKKSHLSLFKNAGTWSLDQHRKKVMDWLIVKYA
ncbi:MAG: hypothetical protein AAB442_02390 [Patescibacteria group bacterium]